MLESAVLPIGGKGRRMKSFSNIPKLIIKLNGKPLIERTLEKLSAEGIKKIFLISNNESFKIEHYCAEVCEKLSLTLKVLKENKYKGNFGGILENKDLLPEEFIVVYPDLFWVCDIKKIYDHHLLSQAYITIVVRRTDHPYDSDTVKLCPKLNVKSIFSKVTKTKKINYEHNDLYGATGIYILNKKYLSISSSVKFRNAEIDLFESIERNQKTNIIHLSAYITSEYIKDCGTPERFEKVSKDISSGSILRSSYAYKQKILFLDRDGTLIRNDDKIYITSPEQVSLKEEIIPIYRKYTLMNYLPIVVTNQPQVSHGKLSFENLDKIHCKIQDLLEERNLTKILKFVVCPHHPHHGYLGEIKELKYFCNCRKPNIGMFNEVKRSIDIDIDNSLMIGDQKVDEKFANNCGIKFLSINEI